MLFTALVNLCCSYAFSILHSAINAKDLIRNAQVIYFYNSAAQWIETNLSNVLEK